MLSWIKSKGARLSNRRRWPRAHPPNTFVRIDHHDFALEDLHERVFRISGFDGRLIDKQRFEFQFVIPCGDGEPDIIPGHGVVARVNDDQLTATYREQQPYFRRVIADFIGEHRTDERVGGKK